MLDRREHARDQNGCQRRRENKARRIRTDDIDNLLLRRDIATHDAERFAKRPFDNCDAVRHIIALGNPPAARPVHADRMHFIAIGERVIFVG